jgi:hypothetical protein
MNSLWRRAFRLPQTYLLLIGAGLGYGALIVWVGAKPLVWVAGGAIAIGMVALWLRRLRPRNFSVEANLLQPEVFAARLSEIEAKVPSSQTKSQVWVEAYRWTQSCHQYATAIAQRSPTLTADLVETLYTVLGLFDQVVESLRALEQVQTEEYRRLTVAHLQESRDRLQDTHNQLQQLQDQMLISGLSRDAVGADANLPVRLRVVIDANKTALQPPQSPPA